jgi:hypothetical protein
VVPVYFIFRTARSSPFSTRPPAWLTFLLSLSFFFLTFYPPALAEGPENREYALKAGFIYNFTKFITWPDEVNRTMRKKGLTLCVLGQDPFGPILETLSKKLKDRDVTLHIKRPASSQYLSQCNIVFISASENGRLKNILSRYTGSPILFIGDTKEYGRQGVGINFYIDSNKIRFEINANSLKKRNIRIGSELLDIAKIISSEGSP